MKENDNGDSRFGNESQIKNEIKCGVKESDNGGQWRGTKERERAKARERQG